MTTNDPRGRISDDDPSGRTSVLPANPSGWSMPEQRPPEFASYGPENPGDTRRLDFSGSEILPPAPRTGGMWSRGQKVAVGLALVAMALGGGVAGAFVATSFATPQTTVATSPIVNVPAGSGTTSLAAVAKAVQPSVVSIAVRTGSGGGEGSGVILSADGRILTNNHVVEAGGQGGEITVTFSDGRTARGSIVGTDPVTDLAVIRAENVSNLTPAALGDSDKLQVGDTVLAIGSPLGLQGSVTAGIISALNRTVPVGGDEGPRFPGGADQSSSTTITGAIQTDAPINPGNSGGALVNASGQVIGINAAIATNGGEGNIGVGFSIPINTARQVADQLISTGKATHAFLGVGLADAMGAPGAVVGTVEADSPAAQAGLREGDRITKINETTVTGSDTVIAAIRGFKPGDKVTLTYVRDGKTATVTVTLAERTAD
ncbi:trypsin-like peptidase domain-containing protein [Thermopolyspora sp. NPDC052614]|uniref:S1C family serine protease n=1 Tax=Thermopolyspora sp. NPDC052614 TaxID=3155682 RepID=UPI00341F45EC